MAIPLNSVPGSTVRGTLTELFGVTKTHGAIQLPVTQTVSLDWKFATNSLGEFATNKDVFVSQSFKNVEGSFEMFLTDLVTLYNLIMDLPPALSTQTPVAFLPEQMYGVPFNLFGNAYHQFTTGTKFEGFMLTQCKVMSISESRPLDNDAKVTVKILANWGSKTEQGAIRYNRLVSSAPVYSSTNPQPSDISVTGGHIWYLDRTAVAIPLPGTGTTTQVDLASFKNGLQIYPTFGTSTVYTINYGNQWTYPGTVASTDVFETYYLYSSVAATP